MINITGVKADDYNAWITATKMISQLQETKISKDYAQILFETCLSILKKAIR